MDSHAAYLPLWTDDATDSSPRRGRSIGRDRAPAIQPRQHRLNVRFTSREFGAVLEAALTAALTPTGYVADSALNAAAQSAATTGEPLRVALRELMAARTQLRLLCEALRDVGTAPETSAPTDCTSTSTDRRTTLTGVVRRAHESIRRLDDAAARVVRAMR